MTAYAVTGHATLDGAELTTKATLTVTDAVPLKIIGMSAPANLWDQRVGEVGAAGVEARRIFGSLTAAGNSQGGLITDAHAAGMLPVVSYKLPSVANAITGSYDAWATAAATFLASFNKPTAVTICHEPRGDMTPAQYVALHERLVPIFKRGQLKVGPILNGFLLDNTSGRTEFATYTSSTLFGLWDWFGIDTYHPDVNSSVYPGDRIDPLVSFLASKGKATMPIGVGEYNGFTADAIAVSGEKFLSTPTLWFACVWNSTGGLGTPLTTDRLAAYQVTKADARAQH